MCCALLFPLVLWGCSVSDGKIALSQFDAGTGRAIRSIEIGREDEVSGMSLSPKGTSACLRLSGSILIVDLATGKAKAELSLPGAEYRFLGIYGWASEQEVLLWGHPTAGSSSFYSVKQPFKSIEFADTVSGNLSFDGIPATSALIAARRIDAAGIVPFPNSSGVPTAFSLRQLIFPPHDNAVVNIATGGIALVGRKSDKQGLWFVGEASAVLMDPDVTRLMDAIQSESITVLTVLKGKLSERYVVACHMKDGTILWQEKLSCVAGIQFG